MPTIGRNAKLYMERRLPAYQQTLRGPGPQIYLPDNPVNHIALEAPLPAPKFLYQQRYVDGGLTKPWPDGTCETCNS